MEALLRCATFCSDESLENKKKLSERRVWTSSEGPEFDSRIGIVTASVACHVKVATWVFIVHKRALERQASCCSQPLQGKPLAFEAFGISEQWRRL